jgi:hypothetical protein
MSNFKRNLSKFQLTNNLHINLILINIAYLIDKISINIDCIDRQPHSLYSLVPSKYIYSTASWSGNRFYILNISLKNSQLVRSQGWCLRGSFNHLKINLGEVSFEDIYQEFFCTGHMKNTKCTHISNYQYKNYRTQILHPL